MTLTLQQQWLMENAQLLSDVFGDRQVVLDGSAWSFLIIHGFPLPENWRQTDSDLLIRIPDIATVFSVFPNHFYLPKGLTTIKGTKPAHYFESADYNDLKESGWARFSFHIKSGWQPALPCSEGTTFLDLLEKLHQGMYQAAEEAES